MFRYYKANRSNKLVKINIKISHLLVSTADVSLCLNICLSVCFAPGAEGLSCLSRPQS